MKKALIYTTEDILESDLKEVEELLPTKFTIKETDLEPSSFWNPYFKYFEISWNWFRANLPSLGNDIVCYHTSQTQLREVRVTDLLGMYSLDNNKVHEFWIGSSKKLRAKAEKNGFKSNFAWLFIHEYLHGAEHFAKVKDRVHEMEKQGKLKDLLMIHRERELLKRKKTLLERIVSLLTKLLRLKMRTVTPLPQEYWDSVSQRYGRVNKKYPLTGRHIGVDCACPEKTPVRARADGRLVDAGFGQATGVYCIYEFTVNGQVYQERYCHLSATYPLNWYKAGDIIAETGNTGQSTGPHCHIDTWYNKVNLAGITKHNWDELTLDPKSI